jgi:hypothetical protein
MNHFPLNNSFDAYMQLPLNERHFEEIDLCDGEPPLLKELGFDFDHMKRKMIVVMNPLTRGLEQDLRDDCDLTGPLILCLLLGLVLTLSRGWAFDYVYGFASIGSLSVWALVNLLNNPGSEGIGIYHTVSVLGYGMFPFIPLATLSIFISLNTMMGLVITFMFVVWSTSSASMMFISASSYRKDGRLLLAYPLALYYSCFALLTVF